MGEIARPAEELLNWQVTCSVGSISLATCSFCLKNVSLKERMNERHEVQSSYFPFSYDRYPRTTAQQAFSQPTDRQIDQPTYRLTNRPTNQPTTINLIHDFL